MTPTTIVLTNARRDHKNLFATKDEPVKAHLLRNVWPELILNALIPHPIRPAVSAPGELTMRGGL